jgi:hypothetical protein
MLKRDPNDPARWPHRIVNIVTVPVAVYAFYWMIVRGYRGDASAFVAGLILMIPQAAIGLVYHRRSKLFWAGYALCVVGVFVFAYIYRESPVKL